MTSESETTATDGALLETPVTVVTGLRGGLLLMMIVGLLVGFSGVVSYAVIVLRETLADLALLLTVVVFPVTALTLLSLWGSSVRRLELRPDGVTFHKPLNPLHVSWSWLMPPCHRYGLGEIAISFHPRGDLRDESWAFLNLSQAKALLAHPMCPKWKLSSQVLRSLGMSDLEYGS